MHETYHMNLQEREVKDEQEISALLTQQKYAIIAMCRNAEPYLVTLNYGYDGETDVLYFHSASAGLKLDILRENPRVCATVIEDQGYLVGQCAHAYRSVVMTGTMATVYDPAEKEHGMRLMLYQLEPHPKKLEERLLQSDKFLEKTVMLKLKIENKRCKQGQ